MHPCSKSQADALVDGVEVRDLAVAFEDLCDAGELGFFLCHRSENIHCATLFECDVRGFRFRFYKLVDANFSVVQLLCGFFSVDVPIDPIVFDLHKQCLW
jgi:hypothetical protein